jgi:hypothetical protein
MNDLDDRLKQYYHAQRLEPSAIDDILENSAAESNQKSIWGWKNRVPALTLPALPIAAVFAAMMITASLFTHHYGSQGERMTRMLHEAAMNHTTRLQLEFESSSVASINNSMQQLPFTVALPDEFKHGFDVLGARYCTISGHLAAHLKLVDRDSNQKVSLFMARASDDLSQIKPTQQGVDGIDVQLWNESGLFYAKAQSGS